MRPDFHVFYCHQRTGCSIDSYDPEPMQLGHIVDLVTDVLENAGDFLGLVDDDQGLLQFMVLARDDDDDRPIRMEMPDMARHGCYMKQVSAGEVIDVLHRLPSKLSVDAVPGLRFTSCNGR